MLSIVQMPAGIPVGTLAIGVAGATNAALLAAAILANKYDNVRTALDQFRTEQTDGVLAQPLPSRTPHDMKIGVIGAGQLGRMLALAGYPLGLRFVFLDQSADAPGAQVGRIVTGAFDDRSRLAELAREVDVITFDVENVPVEAVAEIAATKPFLPPVAALGASQDRLHEKTLFRQLKIPTPPFAAVDSLADLEAAIAKIGTPGVLKTRRLGYDGRGQYQVRKPQDAAAAWEALGSVPLIYEQFVKFSREVSIIGVRSTRGETRFYPLAANTHSAGILRYSIAPYRHASLQKQAETYLKRLLLHFDYAGVLTIEFFVARGRLIANEMAPRVHNSGHWTIEGRADQPVRESRAGDPRAAARRAPGRSAIAPC